jgi:hypothetical protein
MGASPEEMDGGIAESRCTIETKVTAFVEEVKTFLRERNGAFEKSKTPAGDVSPKFARHVAASLETG